jgi:hypothetical protein
MSPSEAAAAVAAFNGPDRSYADFFAAGDDRGAGGGGAGAAGAQQRRGGGGAGAASGSPSSQQQQPWWGGDGRGLAQQQQQQQDGDYHDGRLPGGGGNAFVRPSAAVSSPLAADAPPRRRLGTASPEDALLRLHCVDLDEARLWEVMTAMALHDKVWISPRPQGSDAVLAPRARLRSNAALRAAARDAGVPVYAIKTSSSANLVRAFRTLLGVDPSAGGVVFAAGGGGAGGGRGSPGAGSSLDESDSAAAALEGSPAMAAARLALAGDGGGAGEGVAVATGPGGMPRLASFFAAGGEEGDGASSSPPQPVGLPSAARVEREALEEAQMAAETIVRPLGEPVELLPRPRALLERQRALIKRLGLASEVLEPEDGATGEARLRVVPVSAAQEGDA